MKNMSYILQLCQIFIIIVIHCSIIVHKNWICNTESTSPLVSPCSISKVELYKFWLFSKTWDSLWIINRLWINATFGESTTRASYFKCIALLTKNIKLALIIYYFLCIFTLNGQCIVIKLCWNEMNEIKIW